VTGAITPGTVNTLYAVKIRIEADKQGGAAP
jgi:hypothetical protein